jgi:hypothetical protein
VVTPVAAVTAGVPPTSPMIRTLAACPPPGPTDRPVRWLLIDGYVYDVRDHQDQPHSRQRLMNGDPRSWRELTAGPLDEI